MLLFTENCDICGGGHERVFRDTWTGIELCLMCLTQDNLLMRVTMSPASEGDNFVEQLRESHGDEIEVAVG
jgi:hypothetical protein